MTFKIEPIGCWTQTVDWDNPISDLKVHIMFFGSHVATVRVPHNTDSDEVVDVFTREVFRDAEKRTEDWFRNE